MTNAFFKALRRAGKKSIGTYDYEGEKYRRRQEVYEKYTKRKSSNYIKDAKLRGSVRDLYNKAESARNKAIAGRLLKLSVDRKSGVKYTERPSAFGRTLSNVTAVRRGSKMSSSANIMRGRGRPKGSVKYNIPGIGPVGVYEFRMWLRQQNRERRAALERQRTLSPDQQRALAELQYRQQAQMQDPEKRIIPDTSGNVGMRSIQDEIDDAANAVP